MHYLNFLSLFIFYALGSGPWFSSPAKPLWTKLKSAFDWLYRVGLAALLIGWFLYFDADLHEQLNTRFADNVDWMRRGAIYCLIVSYFAVGMLSVAYTYDIHLIHSVTSKAPSARLDDDAAILDNGAEGDAADIGDDSSGDDDYYFDDIAECRKRK